ncbi:MAG: hypothetical protein M1818_005561 [Claussenomyces sp. TS43310]|nr:MAG: hypothetical protein M1818_005561 [Claussenomyces sp. TS43310]
MAVAAAATAAASRLTPPVLPLIVRNPYLSTWLSNAREAPWENWPMFYTGQAIGLSILAFVPESETVYPLLGKPQDSLDQSDDSYNISFSHYNGASFDASTTNLTYLIPSTESSKAPVEVVVSFLSPITPTSTLRQAIPASYISIYVKGLFDVNVYIDVNGEWVSGDSENDISWKFDQSAASHGFNGQVLKTWMVSRAEERLFTEIEDRAEWGTLHFTGPANVQHESGSSSQIRQRFSRTGTLQNVVDESFQTAMDDQPVAAFSKSFKLRGNESAADGVANDSVLFTIAHIQDPIAQFASARGLTWMKPLWASWFATAQSLLSFHYHDFDVAEKLARNYSEQLDSDALRSGSEDYKEIVALSARQVLGATSFSGTPEDPILFMKEISSNGDFQTIDVIFPAFPFFLYTNPRWLAHLLEPLLEHQLAGLYPNAYSMHDLGTFPNATGYPDGRDEYMPVEECGDMLIMGLALINALRYDTKPASLWSPVGESRYFDPTAAHAFSLTVDDLGMDNSLSGPITGQGAKQARKWVERSYKLWKQWTGYLVREALIPKNQLSTDDFAGWLANQTNLALKGIIGIRAMSEISEIIGDTEDAKYYRNISDVYIKKWEEYGISRDKTHAKLAYTWYGSWTTLYNLFADALLCFHLPSHPSGDLGQSVLQKPLIDEVTKTSRTAFVDERIYKMQSDWYHNVRQKFGLPLDNRHLYSKSDWEFFTLAVTSKTVREEIMQSIALWINETSTDRPLTDLYDTEGDGGFPGVNFFARPVVGAHFSFLALERACDGKAMAGLSFLNDQEPEVIDVARALRETSLEEI